MNSEDVECKEEMCIIKEEEETSLVLLWCCAIQAVYGSFRVPHVDLSLLWSLARRIRAERYYITLHIRREDVRLGTHTHSSSVCEIQSIETITSKAIFFLPILKAMIDQELFEDICFYLAR